MLRFSLGVCAVLFAGQVTAGTITQVMSVRQGSHDTSYLPYSQFDPSLGTLTEVRLDFTNGLARSNYWTFRCDLDTPVTATNTIYSSLGYGDQFIDLTRSFVDTFTPDLNIINHQTLISFAGTTIESGPLDRWIGTGINILAPDTFIGGFAGFAGTTSPAVFSFCDATGSVTFTETITYTYSSVPEPMSWVLWVTGLTGITVISGRRA